MVINPETYYDLKTTLF